MKLLIDTSLPPSKAIRKWVYGFAGKQGGLKSAKARGNKNSKAYKDYYSKLAALGRAAQKKRREEASK